jgi:uncharacterized heparinase superfamily protein
MRTLQKLRRTSLAELRERGAQAVSAFAERRAWSSTARLVSDQDFLELIDQESISDALSLLEHFRNRENPRFFASFLDRQTTTTELDRRWPSARQRIIDQADRIISGKFDLLAFKNLSFGDPIDWHFEPIANKRTPRLHWSRLNYLDAGVAGDKKIIWELNRHQHFLTLGQAYWLTNDEHYAASFLSQINSWIDQNPPKLGINWASSLEVAFRSIAWLWALHFFKSSTQLSPESFLQILKFLYLNARHLERYLSTYFSPNTHLTGEALGLFYLGTLLPEFGEATRWREKGLQTLTEQLSKHVKRDGVYFEQSSYYHRYTVDFYLHLLILLRANGEKLPIQLPEKLILLLDHLMYITRPDGTTPLFGDDDGGRLLKLDGSGPRDFRAALSTGAAIFNRGDYIFVAAEAREETLWLLGSQGLSELDRLVPVEPKQQSIGFADSGYYVMRDGWNADANYLLFDCGPHGTENCGHAHADALSIEVAARGRTFLVDPGTCTYTGAQQLRDWFRSSAAHNTLTIDRESSSIPAGPFSWSSIALSECHAWFSRMRFDYVVGSHDGYAGLASPAGHRRTILFLKNDYWVVRDKVRSDGDHLLQLWFHFDVDVAPLHSREHLHLLSENGRSARLQVWTFAPRGQWSREKGWVSDCYGGREEAPVFAHTLVSHGSEELLTILLPEEVGTQGKTVVREIEAINGRGYEINKDGTHDVLLVTPSGDAQYYESVETARMASDFEMTWVRFADEHAREPEELVLIGGSRLNLEGREVVNSTGTIPFLVATRIGNHYRVETEAGVIEIPNLTIGDTAKLFPPTTP